MKGRIFAVVSAVFLVFAFSSDATANSRFEVDPADAKTSYEPGDVITINFIADLDVFNFSINIITISGNPPVII